jgi:DNA-binding Lrp family transcriptional regulator
MKKHNGKPGPLMDNIKYAIMSYLQAATMEKSTQSDIQENLGIWRNQLLQAVDELVNEGKIEVLKIGAARLHRIKKIELPIEQPSH